MRAPGGGGVCGAVCGRGGAVALCRVAGREVEAVLWFRSVPCAMCCEAAPSRGPARPRALVHGVCNGWNVWGARTVAAGDVLCGGCDKGIRALTVLHMA